MKKYIYFGLTIIALVSVILFQQERIKVIDAERNIFRQNTQTLMDSVNRYKTSNSLNVVSVSQLELKLSELEKYRSADMNLIETLRVDVKRLTQITKAQTQTIYELAGTVHDSIVYRDNYITDTLHCIEIAEKWFDLAGCIDENSKFAGKLQYRDSLCYIEHIIPKRFWFVKWGCKERRQEIVSLNPNTRIVGAEYITIRK